MVAHQSILHMRPYHNTSMVNTLIFPFFVMHQLFSVNILLVNLNASVVLAFLPMHLIDIEDPPTWKLGHFLLFQRYAFSISL